MVEGAVFLSYASEDRAAVEAIANALEEAGVDVWFDRQELLPGDPFEEKIKRNIERCSLFLPIISQHTLTSRRRFFRSEWHHAQEEAKRSRPVMRFIVPVAIDDTSAEEQAIRVPFAAPIGIASRRQDNAGVRRLHLAAVSEYQKAVVGA
jgi:hypothetical protein